MLQADSLTFFLIALLGLAINVSLVNGLVRWSSFWKVEHSKASEPSFFMFHVVIAFGRRA